MIVYNIDIYWNVSKGDNHMQNDKPFRKKKTFSFFAWYKKKKV